MAWRSEVELTAQMLVASRRLQELPALEGDQKDFDVLPHLEDQLVVGPGDQEASRAGPGPFWASFWKTGERLPRFFDGSYDSLRRKRIEQED